MRLLVYVVLLAGMFATSASASDAVGFRRTRIDDPVRPLDVAVWYPTEATGATTLVGDNAVLVGEPVQEDAPPTAGRHRLVVLSHGYSGNWTNQAWLAIALAKQGYVVAGLNHPGTTSRDMDKARAGLTDRPRDLSRLIDYLTSDPAWSGLIEPINVAAIGHSLGGWTVIALAGGRFDPARSDADCRDHPNLAACRVGRETGAGQGFAIRQNFDVALRDRRVGAVVTLDLGLARGFDPASLAAFAVPVLVIAAGNGDEGIPAALESGYLAGHLPKATTRSVAIQGAAHFSFLPFCKPGAVAVLEADRPGDGVVCRDGEEGRRAAVHEQVIREVIGFLAAPPR
jgi:predicted dienelactone hydrolase